MGRCITATVSTASILRWAKLRTMGNGHSLSLVCAFAGDDRKLALYFESYVCVFWTTASTTFIWTWFVIIMFKLWCILCHELLCNLWRWQLNLVRSWLLCEMVWNSSGFHGLPGYTGLSLLNCSLVGWFSYLISYNWAVLLHLSPGRVLPLGMRHQSNLRFPELYQRWLVRPYRGFCTVLFEIPLQLDRNSIRIVVAPG
jgi:hypothetical protein